MNIPRTCKAVGDTERSKARGEMSVCIGRCKLRAYSAGSPKARKAFSWLSALCESTSLRASPIRVPTTPSRRSSITNSSAHSGSTCGQDHARSRALLLLLDPWCSISWHDLCSALDRLVLNGGAATGDDALGQLDEGRPLPSSAL